MTKRFDGRAVLVTGASRGLGRAIAIAFGREGATVLIGYRTGAKAAAETLDLVVKAGGGGEAIELDVTNAPAVEKTLAGRSIDVLVNNAAIAHDTPFALLERESWDDVLRTNLTGSFVVTRAVVRSMLQRGKGCIVNVASVAAIHASPGQASYAASKGGLIALTKTLAAELAPKGIRVNAVVPGLLDAGMAARLDRRVAEKRRASIPLGRFGTSEEAANVVLFVASDEAAYVVGQSIVVDGGLSA